VALRHRYSEGSPRRSPSFSASTRSARACSASSSARR
jgi:hypothetical protein